MVAEEEDEGPSALIDDHDDHDNDDRRVHLETVEELLSRAEALAGPEPVELPHVLHALSEVVAERSLSPQQDHAYYTFCVRLASEPSAGTYVGYPAGSWQERLHSVNARHLRREAAKAQRQRYLAKLVLSGWRHAARSASPVWDAVGAAGASPTAEAAALAAPDISRISAPGVSSQGLWDKPESRWSLTDAGDPLVAPTYGDSQGALTPPSRAAARESPSPGGVFSSPVSTGELAFSPPRPDWAAALLCGCFRKWAIHTDEARHMRLEFSHAVAQFEEEAERWYEYVLTRTFRVWRLCIRMQIAAAFAAETVYRYCWRRWTLLVRVTLAELHREDVLLCCCLAAFRQICVAIAHERRYQARAALLRLSLAAAHGQQKRLACAYWGQHALDAPWGRWIDFAREHARERKVAQLAEGCTTRWMPMKMAGWLSRWAVYSEEKAASKRRHATAEAYARRMKWGVCVQKWFRYAQVRKHKLRRVAQVLIYVSTRLIVTTMSRWRDIAKVGRKMRNILMRLSHRILSNSWAGWTERVAGWKRKELIAGLAASYLPATVKRSAFCVWYENVTQNRVVDDKLKNAVARLLNLALGAAFATWADSTATIVTHRNKLERIISLLMNRALHAAFRGWEASTINKRMDREKMLRVIKMFQNLRTGAAFHGWFARVDEKITNREKMARVIKVLHNCRLSSAFGAWKDRIDHKIVNREQLERAVKLMLNMTLNAAFTGWYDNASTKRANNAKVRKCIMVMCNALVMSAFSGWHTAASMRRANNAKVKKCIVIMSNALVMSAFSGWRTTAVSKIENRAMLTRVVSIMTNFALSSAWGGWCNYVDQRTSNRSKVNRVVNRMHNSLIGTSFVRWGNYTDAIFLAREQLYTTVLRCDKCGCLQRVVSAWHRATRKLKRRRRKREHERLQYVVYRKVLTHIRGAAKVRAFSTWVAYVTANVRDRETMVKCMTFFTSKTLSAAFSKWVFTLSEMMHNRDRLERFILILFNRFLRGAFNGWKFNALLKAQNRDRMMRVVKMFQSQAISAAFNSWYEGTQRVLEERRLLTAAVATMSMRTIRCAFHAWSTGTIERIHQRGVMLRAAKLIANFRTAAAFKGWYARCIDKSEQRDKVDQAVRHILHRDLSWAFNSWVANACELTESRRIMMAVIKTFTRRGLAAALSRWHDFAMESIEMRALLARTVSAMRNATIRSYFRLWSESLRGDQALRYLLNRSVARAFVSWSDRVQEANEHSARVQRSLQMIANRTLGAAMHGWVHAVDVAKSHREALSTILQRFRGRATLCALLGWKEAVDNLLDRREMLAQVLKTFGNRAMSAAFHSWQELAVQRASRQEKLHQALQILGGSRRGSAFYGWVAKVQQRVGNRMKLEAVRARMCSRSLAGAFTTWSCYGAEKIKTRSKLEAVLLRLSQLVLAAAFAAWATVAQRSLHVHGIIYELTMKWRNGRSRQIFEAWFVWAARRTELSALHQAVTHAREQRAKADLVRGWNLLFVACCTYRLFMARLALRTWVKWAMHVKHMRLLARAMAKLSRRTVTLCFDAWKDVNNTYVRRQETLQKVLSKINNRALSAAFSAWGDCAVEQAEFGKWASLKAESLARRLLGDMVYTAFRSWREWIMRRERTRLIGARIETSRAHKARRQRMAQWRQRYVQSTVIWRIRRQGVVAAWGNWMDFLQDVKRRQGQVKAAAQRWRLSTTAGRFYHWHKTIVEANRIHIAATRLQTRQWWLRWRRHSQELALNRLQSAVNRILQHRAGMALEKWHEFCAVRVQQRGVVAAAVKRIQQRGLMSTFKQWHHAMHAQAAANNAVAKAVNRLRLRLAASAFAMWASLSARSAYERKVLAGAVHKLRMRAVDMTFRRWWAQTEHSLELRSLLRLWLGRRVAAMLGHYISAWHDAVLVNGHRRWAADTIAVATCARLATRAWKAWVLAHQCEMLQQKCNARHARIVLHLWFSASQRSAEQRWRLQAMAARRIQRRNGLLLSAWRYHALYSRRSREVVGTSRLRRHRAHAAYCLDVWRHSVAYAVELRHALQLWLGRKVAVMLTASFRRWLEFCTKQAATELTWARAVDFASARINAALDRCFFALRRHVLAKSQQRQLRDMAVDCNSQHRLRECFECWRGRLAELAIAARHNSLVLGGGGLDSSLGDYLDASTVPPPTYARQPTIEPVMAAAPSPWQSTEPLATRAAPGQWQSESLTQLGRDLEALASSFAMVGRPAMAGAASQ